MIRPLDHLHTAGRMYPAAWKAVDEFRASRGVGLPKWPNWCFLPMAGWYAIVSADAGADRLGLDRIDDVSRLAAIGTWRYTQGVYRFDLDIAAELSDTLLKGEIPSEVLLRLPEWSIYIETPGRTWMGSELYGFWVHLEWDANTERKELRLLIDCEKALMPVPVHIGPWTVTEAIDRMIGEGRRQAQIAGLSTQGVPDNLVERMSSEIQPLLALVMYICSDEPEIEDREHPGEQPGRPQPKRTKRGWRLFPAQKPRIWAVGEKTGDLLRKARAELGEKTDRKVSPHIRRAHWHGFWTGPKAGDRKFIYKWLPPTLVAAE